MTEAGRVYGEALYELSLEESLEDRILGELKAAVGLFEENPKYLALMGLHSVPKRERLAALSEAFEGRVHPYLLNFLKLLTERGALSEAKSALEAFTARYNADKGILPVRAVSARELSEREISLLKEKLDAMTGKNVIISAETDPSLLGGVRLTMDGKLYDGSVRGRLREIEKSLSNAVL